MLKKLTLLIAIFLFFGGTISARAKYQGIAEKGGKAVKTSTTVTYKLSETYPTCTIDVYLTGTTTHASIYSDNLGSVKSNPFFANTDASYFFYADNGRYDIKFSGAGIVSSFTKSDISLIDPADKTFYPENYGAISGGIVQNRTAFVNLCTDLKSVNGGTIYIKKGKWLYSPTGSYSNSTDTFCQEASNILIQGEGWGSELVIGGNFGARFGIPYQSQNCLVLGGCAWINPSVARFNSATIGDKTITLTTIADNTLFAVGNTIYLESGDAAPTTGHAPYNFQFNKITAINTGTGVITLESNLLNSYDSSDVTYFPRIVRLNSAPNNITIRDIKFTRAAPNATILDFNNTRNVFLENVEVSGTVYNGYSDFVTYRNCKFASSDPTNGTENTFDIGDATSNMTLDSVEVYNQGMYGFSGAGALRDLVIKNSKFHSFGQVGSGSALGISVGGRLNTRLARRITLDNNVIFIPGNTTNNGIIVSNVENVIIKNNLVIGRTSTSDNAGIAIEGTVKNSSITGNNINITGNGIGLLFLANDALDTITNNVVTNNIFVAPNFGIFLSNGSAGTINKNQFTSNIITSTVRYRLSPFLDNSVDLFDVSDKRATLTVSGAATTVTATFINTVDATTYYSVTCTPVSSTGSPATGSNRILKVIKSTTGYQINVETAPGVGNTVSFDCIVGG